MLSLNDQIYVAHVFYLPALPRQVDPYQRFDGAVEHKSLCYNKTVALEPLASHIGGVVRRGNHFYLFLIDGSEGER